MKSTDGNVIYVDVLELVREHAIASECMVEERLLLHGSTLGKQLAAILEPIIVQATEHSLVVLDMSRVFATSDCIDSIVHSPEVKFPLGCTCIIQDPEPSTEYALHRAFQRKQTACIALHTTASVWQVRYLGEMMGYVKRVFELVFDEAVTSVRVVEKLGMSKSDASNRLRKLTDEGLLIRTPSTSGRSDHLMFLYILPYQKIASVPGWNNQDIRWSVYQSDVD